MGKCGRSEREAALTSFNEYRLLLDGFEERMRERWELARWICFNIYSQNPYINPPKAHTVKSYIRFPWEKMTAEEANALQDRCHVTAEEQAELDKIFKAVFGE